MVKIAPAAYRFAAPFTLSFQCCTTKLKAVKIHELNRIIKVFKAYNFQTTNTSSHTLRKTFGMRFFETHGATERALILTSKILNHEILEETKKYIGIDRVKIEKNYLKL